jgi:fructokinase
MSKVPILFGEVLFDCFEDGSRVLGGAPFNAAWHLQAFDCRPLLISRVGDDPQGRDVRDQMQHWGMTTAGLQMDSAHQTGEVRVALDNGQPSFDILANRAFDHIQGNVIPPVEPFLIYHGSLALRQAESSQALVALKERHPVPVFLDVNLRPPWWNWPQLGLLLDGAHWVKINDDELIALSGKRADDLYKRAEIVIDRHGLSLLIVTRGEQGAFAMEKGQDPVEIAPAPGVEVVDTVGAGDAFAAVAMVGLIRGWPLQTILQRAQGFASLLVERRGAILDDRTVYQEVIETWHNDKLSA